MNEVKLTVELCTEDRARLDKIIEGLGAIGRPDCSACVKGVAEYMDRAADAIDKAGKTHEANAALVAEDPVKQAITDVLAKVQPKPVEEAPKNAQEATEASTPPSTPKTEEVTTAETDAPWAEPTAPTVTVAELQALVIALCRLKKQAEIKAVISEYGAQTVAQVPEDKVGEVYAKLKKLEG